MVGYGSGRYLQRLQGTLYIMHYYQFNIGDYAKSTLHLSQIEDLVYRRLLDRYYDTEKPLDSDINKLCRFIRMSDYKKETQQVLEEFFSLTQKGWIQKRVQRELGVYSAKAETARANGKKGGRPKKTQSVLSGNPELTQEKAKQEPLTNNHKPIDKDMSSAKADPIPYSEILNIYNDTVKVLPKALKLNDKRKRSIKKLWHSKDEKGNLSYQNLSFYPRWFAWVDKNKFCTGEGSTGWIADFDFCVSIEKIEKAREGKYGN